jgi:leader peptidase (prepilin peptidase)/N-methyltransferase
MSGALLWALWARWGGAQGVWAGWFAASFVAGALLLAIAFTDCESRRIPDELLVALAATGLAASPLNPHFHASPRDRVLWSLAGAGVGLAIGWLLYRAARAYYRREAFGEGDVYLLAGVGAWSGMRGAYDCLLLGSLLGTLFFLPLWLRGRVGGRTKIPFGPFLSAGAVVNLFWLLPWTW